MTTEDWEETNKAALKITSATIKGVKIGQDSEDQISCCHATGIMHNGQLVYATSVPDVKFNYCPWCRKELK